MSLKVTHYVICNFQGHLTYLQGVFAAAKIIWRRGHSLSYRLVSSDRLEVLGIKLPTPGYMASGVSTFDSSIKEYFCKKFQDKSRVKSFLHTACCSMRMSTICLHGNSLGKHFYKIEQDGGYKGKSHVL